MSETTDQNATGDSALPPPYLPPHPQPGPGRPPLVRSRSDRMVAGVAGGLARSFGVDPVVFRVIFAVLALIGGSGILLYVLLWLLVPEEDSDGSSVADRWVRSRSWSAATVLLLAVGLAVVAGIVVGLDPTPLFLLGIIGVIAFLLLRRENRSAAATGPPVHYGPAAPPASYAAPAAYAGTRPYAQVTQPYVSADPTSGGPAHPVAPTPPERSHMTQTYPTRPYADLPPVVPYPPVAPAPPPPPRPPKEKSALGVLTLGLAAVTAGVLVAIRLAAGDQVPNATVILAATTLVVGLGLLVGTLVGRARWLVIPGVILVLATAGTATADDFDGPRGNRTFAPTSAAQVQSTYDWGAGELVIDLSQVVGDPDLTVAADLGVGSLRVIVPEGAELHVAADAGAGSIRLPDGTEQNGFGQDVNVTTSPPASVATDQTITLDLEVGLGEVVVSRA